MVLSLEQQLRRAVLEHLRNAYGLHHSDLVIEQPPRPELGDFALPLCFELAKKLRRAPRQIAQEMQAGLRLPDIFARVEVAGSGYLNVFVERGRALAAWQARDAALEPRLGGKAIVEHTNINPNKAAHVGHLRNAVLGDTFVRLLRRRGEQVEVQNYIDNTGVQVADVVVAFERLEGQTPAAVEAAIAGFERRREDAIAEGRLSPSPQALALDAPDRRLPRPHNSFDYRCWDLYAAVSRHYEEHPDALAWRGETLHAIEAATPPTAALAEAISSAIVRAHLRTMARLNVGYDLLPRESEILHLHFWETAFTLLQQRGAIRLEMEGKNAGCWVMDRPQAAGDALGDGDPGAAESKVIVRSNGTVTYVGKDIAYQLWKLGLLGRDFAYRRFQDGVWASTAAPEAQAPVPPFGQATWVFNVIDVRQSYLQEIVVEGLEALGFQEAARHSIHFSYEMVALTPRCAEQLGYRLSEEDAHRPYLEVSGRKGLGIKADDLIDQLQWRAWEEVAKRQPSSSREQQLALALPIAVSALRYFLLKFTKTAVIAFDLDEALSFEGETGPYVQYAAVRAGTILKKAAALSAEDPGLAPLLDENRALELRAEWGRYLETENGLWALIWLAERLDAVVEQCVLTTEPAFLAKYAFQLAQAFSNFYHKHPVLTEADPERRRFLVALVRLLRQQLCAALDLMGIEVPSAM